MVKKVAVYPSSFNPWHQGHSDVLGKALKDWNEDLGLLVPVVLFICGRNYSHISSSAIRATLKIQKG